MKKIPFSFGKTLAAFSIPFLLCCFAAGCDDVLVPDEPAEEDLPQIIPLPQPEIPDDPVDDYDELEILNHVKSDFMWWDGVRPRKRQELSFERGTRCVKLCSDERYIYGYVEVDTDRILSRTGVLSPEYLNNLGVWLDTDGQPSGQGGGWFMSASPKGYDRLLRGRCSESADPQDWKPSVYDVSMGGDSFGQTDPVAGGWINTGTGTGLLEGNVFRYTFTIDRVRLGIDNLEAVSIGISFDSGGYTDYVVIPDRAGYMLKLGSSDEIEYDLENTVEPEPETIDGYLKTDWASWTGVAESDRGTDTQFERGTRCVKFSSDADRLYGYVEVDLTKVYERNTTVSRPEYLNSLGVWLDTDGIHAEQGGGWALSASPKCYDVLLYGNCSDKGEPREWTPEVRDVSRMADNFGSAYSEAAGWEDFAAGAGEVIGDVFFYTFVIDRRCLGIGDVDEVNIAITFNQTKDAYNDWMVVPARCGFTIALSR